MTVLLFALASAMVLCSSSIVVGMLGLPDPLDRALAVATVGAAQIALSLLIAGAALGTMSRSSVLAVNGIALATAAAFLVSRRRRSELRRQLGKLRPRSYAAALARIRSDRFVFILALLAVGEFVWRLVVAYVLPPYGFDALWYHLTTVAGWLQAGKITLNPLVIWSSVYPADGELFFAWPSLFLRSDTIVDTVQLGFAVVGAVAVAAIARKLALGDRGAAIAGLLFFLSPIVLSQSTSNSVDLVLVSSLLVAFNFLLAFLRSAAFAFGVAQGQPDHRLAALAGLGAGLALGAKSLGFLTSGVLVLMLCIHQLTSVLTRRQRLLPVATSLTAFLVPLVALGGFWYVRNWVNYGNPFYPARIELLGHTFFAGLPLSKFLDTPAPHPGSWWSEILWSWHQDQFGLVKPHYVTHDGRPSGFGPLWGYLAAPLLPLFAIAAARRNRAAFVNFLVPVGVIFALQPFRWSSRFTMLLLAAGLIGLGYWLDRVPHRLATISHAAVLGLTLVGLWFSTAKIDAGYAASTVLRHVGKAGSERTIGKLAYGGAFAWTDRIPPGSRVAADTTTPFFSAAPLIWFFYPIYGRHFQNSVYPLHPRDAAELQAQLTRNRIDYAVVARNDRVGALARHSRCLRPVASTTAPPTAVYQVEPPCRRRARSPARLRTRRVGLLERQRERAVWKLRATTSLAPFQR